MERYPVAAVLMGGALLIAAGAALQSVSPAAGGSEATFRFASQPIGHANVYRWGIQRDNVSLPAEIVDTDDWTDAADMVAAGEADMADVSLLHLPRILTENPDLRVLPYQINVPERSFGIWVENGSSITGPADLDGRTVAAPENVTINPRNSGVAILLRADHDVNVTWVRRNTAGEAALDTIADDDVDAALLTGSVRLPDNHSLRPVFLPQRTLTERFGDSGLLRVFVVRGDPGSIERGTRVVQALQVSADRAQRSREAFMETYWYCNEFLVHLEDDPQIERMTPGFRAASQHILDAAAEQDVLDRSVDLERRVVAEPISRP